uniref:Cytochrome b6-f complex subunit 6 n=1 Tax=Coccomyxa subellipsoidea (strain C-169) TaxID=574566 RepID=E9NPY6_COCSC|nr:subunit VI of cytochrome b6/f complex [Coccomyxa subellipsoidea C-169]ADV29832.1 subunit VI of cytochrome b6/f complex [Coccomyxa subellipsoidea C-169]
MITVISYIGILSAFLIAATVMYLGLVKIKLI